MNRPVAISLSPNTEKDDVMLALKVLLHPSLWLDEDLTRKLEASFTKIFRNVYGAIAVNSGRSALYLILKALGVGRGDEVALQALTCVAVPNSILWVGAKPLYIDVDSSFNIDVKDLKNKITKKTKAIIVQHSFGVPADMEKIAGIAKKRGIMVIEDCALSLGAKFKGRPVGTMGDVAFFSFGRDKVVSSVFGGMILCRNIKTHKKILAERNRLSFPNRAWVFQQLLHPILFSLILPTYNFGVGKLSLGKVMLYLFQKIGLLSKAVYDDEKVGRKPSVFPTKMPGALSTLAINQLKKIDKFNTHRQRIAEIYFREIKNSKFKLPPQNKGSIWVRFPIYGENVGKIYELAKKKGLLLGDWYKSVVYPVRDLTFVGYIEGSCPKAEKFSGNMLNLPTYPNLSFHKVKEIVQLIK